MKSPVRGEQPRVITPEAPVDSSRFPTPDAEYTLRQRRIIDGRLARALADTKADRVSRTYSDHGEFIAALHEEVARLSARKPGQRAECGFATRNKRRTTKRPSV